MTCRTPNAVLVLLLALAAGGIAPPAYAQAAAQATGSVSGTVVNERNIRLRRISVTVRNRTTNDEEQDVTDNNGSFSVTNLAPGIYDVVVNEPGFIGFRQEVNVTAGKNEPLNIKLQFTIQDFAPVTDRWGLQFPLWQRYPKEQDGEYPFVSNRGLDPYDQNMLKGDLPVIGNNIFMILTGVAEIPFEFRRVPTPSGVSQEDAGSDEFFGEGEQFSLLPTGLFSFEMFRGSTAFKPRDWAFRVTPAFNLNYVEHERAQRRQRHAGRGQEPAAAGPRAAGSVRRGQAVRRRRQLRLRVGPRRHPAVHQRLQRLPLPRHQSRRARVRQLGPQPQSVERRVFRSAREGNQQRVEPDRAAESEGLSSPTISGRTS